jgi:hypothetical protein
VVPEQLTAADATGHASARTLLGGSAMIQLVSFAALLERFFTQRLMQQRQASVNAAFKCRSASEVEMSHLFFLEGLQRTQ